MKRWLLIGFLLFLLIGEVAFVHFNTGQSGVNANAGQSAQWMADSAVVSGLPELGPIGSNCQCPIFNLTGNGQWGMVIGQCNSDTVNEYPFLGYYWSGLQWVNDASLVNGLTAYPNGNDPTVGFNVTGNDEFDMIVGQWAGNNQGKCWTGYSWDGQQWVVNPTLVNGLPTTAPVGAGSNYATLGYNVLDNGMWDLIVDNWGNNGYEGFEWNGTAWTQATNLLNGLPSAGSPGTTNQCPVPCLVKNFAGDNTWTLIIGLASGGGPNGAIQAFEWGGTAWVSEPTITEGITDLQPWTNSPSVAYNITGDGNWEIIIGSTTSNSNQPAYYTGFYWTENMSPLSATITPSVDSINIGQSIQFTSNGTGGEWPYSYQWYVNGNAVSGASTTSWVYTPTTPGVYSVYLKVTDSTGNTAQSSTALITAEYPTQYRITFGQTGIGANYNGTVVTVDGSSYNATELPLVFEWDSFSTHTFSYQQALIISGNTTDQYGLASISGITLANTNPSNTTLPTAATFNVTAPENITGNYFCQTAVPINRVQGCYQGTTLGTTLTVNMTKQPSVGDVLIGVISSVTDTGSPSSPSTITETGVSWSQLCGGGGGGTALGEHGYSMELWMGKVLDTNASAVITVEFNAPADLGATMAVCEYSGVAKASSAQPDGLQSATTTLTTGEAPVIMNGELAVGGIFDEGYALSNASSGFTLLDGNYTNNQALAYLEKTNCIIGSESSMITVPGNTNGYGCIAIFQPTLVDSNITITNETTVNGVLAFTASGPSGQVGYVNATVPVGYNSTDITVTLDGKTIPQPTITLDGSNYIVSIEFHLSTHNIEINYAADASATPTSTPTPTPIATPTSAPSSSPAPTETPTSSPTASPTPTPTASPSPTVKPTPSPAASPSSSPSTPEFPTLVAILMVFIGLTLSTAALIYYKKEQK